MESQYIDRLLKLIEEHNRGERYRKGEELWKDISRAMDVPVVIDNRAYFMYYGKAQNVMLVGDWTYWQPAIHLNRIEHTDLFYCILDFPDTARLQYKLIVDGEWIIDPSNRRYSREGFGVNSEFWMSKYADTSWLMPTHGNVRRGNVERKEFDSKMLGSRREIFLYTPAHQAGTKLPMIMIHDGGESLSIGHFNHILDNLIDAKKIPPIAALFISPHNRHEEYTLNDKYVDFTVEEALLYAKKQWSERNVRISENPHDSAVLGASLGGLLSTMTSLRHPTVMGSCLVQSPAYWWNHGEIFKSPFMKNASLVHFYLQTGTICDAQELTQLMHRRLALRGAKVDYQEYPQGHTWSNWRTNLATVLQKWLSPAQARVAA